MPISATANEPVNTPRPTLTKIVATIGPASSAPEKIEKLILAGVSVFRLNFSHGHLDEHAERLQTIRQVSARLGLHVAVLGDLQGPKIRVGAIADPGVELHQGQTVRFVPSSALASAPSAPPDVATLPCDYEPIAREVEPGHRVLINDGALRLLAIPHEPADGPDALRAVVTVGGTVTSRKGINLPDSDVSAPALSDRDWACVEWAVAHELDWLAMSFVRKADEVRALRRALAGMCPATHDPADGTEQGSMIPVIAKIEKPQALKEIDGILDAADGIMVARGDLGVEMDLATVPIIQKQLIAKADEWGKPCIVATQMLETMITSAAPTRAEASDVANAILDGADAVMLSAETAVGKHPSLVVETMRRIATEAERELASESSDASPSSRLRDSRYRTAALAHGAWYVAHDIGARLIACWSQEGGTARYLAQTGMNIPIIAYSSSQRHVRRMSLLRGVTALHMPVPGTGKLADWNLAVERDLIARGWAAPGDPIVLLAGKPLGHKGATNTLAIHYIGNTHLGFLAGTDA
ncbi:MAG: pyruvate kinase [Phycisphaeraceae bacterium]|nr:pyruvate kinase [Phycisphaeraceae bacterium]